MIVEKISRAAAAVLSFFIAANVITASAYSSKGTNGPPGDEGCAMSVPFSVRDKNGWIPEGTTFTVELKAVDDAPLPDITVCEIAGSGGSEFGPFEFTEPDNYEYTISEAVFDDDKIIFDKTVYHVYVSVLYNESDELVSCFALTKEGSDVKPEEILFENDYSEPPDESSEPEDPGGSSDIDSISSQDDCVKQSGSKTDQTPWNSILPPNTGAAVTLGFSGLVIAALAIMIIGRRRNDSDDEPTDERSG